jgi:hypothetical protein
VHINFINDPSVANAPVGFQAGLQEAASVIDQKLTDNITVNITVHWGDVGPGPVADAAPTEVPATYDGLLFALHNQETLSADDQSYLANLPATDPANGGLWNLTTAQAKALSLTDPNGTASDGTVRFSSLETYTFSQQNGIALGTEDFVGIAEHEIGHVLGRINGNTPLDLATFQPDGSRNLNAFGPLRYLSFDGGATPLALFDSANGGTPSDFFPVPPLPDFSDPFAFAAVGSVVHAWTDLDSRLMDVLGFTTSQPQQQPEDHHQKDHHHRHGDDEHHHSDKHDLRALFAGSDMTAKDFPETGGQDAPSSGTGSGGLDMPKAPPSLAYLDPSTQQSALAIGHT